MSIAIDPSEMRVPAPAPVKTGAPSRAVRLVVLTILGSVGLVGLSAGAYSMLSGLAAPAPTGVRIGRVSADWPDLRDGVPALVSTTGRTEPVPPVASDPIPIRTVLPPETRLPDPTPVEAKAAEPRPVETTKFATVSPPARPARLPVIENAATVPPAAAVAPVEKVRPAPLVAPTARETIRARPAPDNAFAALPPASATPAHPPKPKPAAVARPKPPANPSAKPAATGADPAKVAAAQPAQAAEPDSEETEVFGMKVPSLAPVGRKFAEGVEAIGNAVKRLPDQF